ncbi:MAG: hypothetical protein ACRC28_18430 [Clostridium sp.]|uniref:hypothetical protein n=1 Tax=Clostridium sp. TaxID=1506 RepID=UPI003F2B169B
MKKVKMENIAIAIFVAGWVLITLMNLTIDKKINKVVTINNTVIEGVERVHVTTTDMKSDFFTVAKHDNIEIEEGIVKATREDGTATIVKVKEVRLMLSDGTRDTVFKNGGK